METSEIKERLLWLARARLKNMPGMFYLFQRLINGTFGSTTDKYLLAVQVACFPGAVIMAAHMGQMEPLDNHLLAFIDDWAARQSPPPLPEPLPFQASVSPASSSYQPSTVHLNNRSDKDGPPPGTLPRNAINRLAVKAAWQIECETGRRASAKNVIARLQQWADKDGESDVLKVSDKENRGVIWITSKLKEKLYSVEACEKTMEAWNKSRD